MRPAHSFALVATVFSLAACGDPVSTSTGVIPPRDEDKTPSAMGTFGSTQIVASAGSAVLPPPGVIVYNANARPVAGARVTFEVTAGGGTVSPAEGVSSANGVVSLNMWKLGPASAINTVVVRAGGATTTFTAFGVDTTEKLVARYKLVRAGNTAAPYDTHYNDLGSVNGLEGTLEFFEGHFVKTLTFQWRYSDGTRQIVTSAGPYVLEANGSVKLGFINLSGTLRGDSLTVSQEKLPDDEVLSTVYVKQ